MNHPDGDFSNSAGTGINPQAGSQPRLGVLLVNLGTPAEPTARGVRNFLKAFLGDPRVVELPRLLWWPILHGIILPFRAPRVAKLYSEIWTERGSPLKVITENQVAALQQHFKEDQVRVDYAMTYGGPSLQQQVAALEAKGCERTLVLPLYPQFSATTTAAIYDQYAAMIRQQRNISDVLIHKFYCERPDYIAALAASIQAHWAAKGQAQRLLFSFHGIPRRCVDLGDPYERHCRQTASQVAEHLQLTEDQWQISFQSRLGKAEWLQPYTDILLTEWAQSGLESVDVICPAFAADCLETVEEIEKENRTLFLKEGGKRFSYIPCLNDAPAHIEMLAEIVREYLPLASAAKD